MTEPTEAVRAHRGGTHGPWPDELVGCHGGTRRRAWGQAGAGGHPADDPPSPGAGPDSVAVLLRKLRDAAAARDEDLSAAPAACLNWTSARAA